MFTIPIGSLKIFFRIIKNTLICIKDLILFTNFFIDRNTNIHISLNVALLELLT